MLQCPIWVPQGLLPPASLGNHRASRLRSNTAPHPSCSAAGHSSLKTFSVLFPYQIQSCLSCNRPLGIHAGGGGSPDQLYHRCDSFWTSFHWSASVRNFRGWRWLCRNEAGGHWVAREGRDSTCLFWKRPAPLILLGSGIRYQWWWADRLERPAWCHQRCWSWLALSSWVWCRWGGCFWNWQTGSHPFGSNLDCFQGML